VLISARLVTERILSGRNNKNKSESNR
jgi:hypothetical protein